ncbi:uncharacterized protein EV420DRAFT_1073067 [Desarmillaria tabescens]|uniref:Uncharacterized protein n=1 Tax=Armillaria tabescens TaxID=1929756 RepID=A0AA39JJ24_ARMTA|nr:uncharacterized protein EV420DRAFT_1073067 [Desarmillaria tabescens]KAK0442676.1 hypothetical protein EV420DRAFT_1073067 [Desarmillaria tabescens]
MTPYKISSLVGNTHSRAISNFCLFKLMLTYVLYRYAASFILSLACSQTGSVDASDSEIVAIQRSLGRVGAAVRPGAFMVDEYPLLRYLPLYRPELRSWTPRSFRCTEIKLQASGYGPALLFEVSP